mmetsp:Transcript_1897/g.3840  ORF Transcript_1897/g.3840 Transcript_1897/m.3840 type:complete len:163 (-) Transcript_1897:536-1024(-)
MKVQVPAPLSNVPPVSHDKQLVAEAPEHVLHDASQALQTLLSSYLPSGQLETQAPLSKSGVTEVGHARQLVLLAAEQLLHVEWQSMHNETLPEVCVKVPVLGHSATHEPLCSEGAKLLSQLRQFVLPASEHVPHDASHGWHSLELSAYLPTDVQEARQDPPS